MNKKKFNLLKKNLLRVEELITEHISLLNTRLQLTNLSKNMLEELDLKKLTSEEKQRHQDLSMENRLLEMAIDMTCDKFENIRHSIHQYKQTSEGQKLKDIYSKLEDIKFDYSLI